jgi:hypothetical protein
MTDADLPSDGVNGAEAREAYERGYNLFHTFGGKSRHEGGLLAVARLAQQSEREAWVGALQTWLASRDVKVAICGGEQVAADLPSLLADVFALLDAAEVRELRAALRKTEQQRDHWRRECSDIQARAALSTKVGGA